MAVVTYKCPNCDAELTFRPKSADFGCEYCGANFSEAQILEIAQKQGIDASQAEEPQPATPSRGDAAADDFAQRAVVYNCPSCGAEVVTDATTAASFCFYCHNPVILGGRLSGAYAPDCLIPFSIGKEEVKDRLLAWCKKKKFIDKAFMSDMQLEKLSGVYFPFWLVDAKADVQMSAEGRSLRVWRVGDIEYTETSSYALERAGTVDFQEITLRGLNRDDVLLLEGLYPYDLSALKAFNMGFLSGFLAEKRNVEQTAAKPQARKIMEESAASLLQDTTSGYGIVTTKSFAAAPASENWRYALLPAWMLTYRYKDELYYFAMNGQTGQIAGRVPASAKKLWGLFGGVAAAVFLVALLIGGLVL